MASTKPMLISIILTTGILTLEKSCELFLPWMAPFFFQFSTTAIVLLIVYNIPRLVHTYLMVEPHWQRSVRDDFYMRRLFTI